MERSRIEEEIRGLLEEIVGDPRSSLRFAPRRSLRNWFDGGEVLKARTADATHAERHLVAAHREALAAMLLEAAKIAYWKAPVLSLRPIGSDGRPYDERKAEQRWRLLAERRVERERESGGSVNLLRACLPGIPAQSGHDLAQAALSLVPSDASRYYVTRTLPWDRPKTAISLLKRLVETADGLWKVCALSSLASRVCSLESTWEARALYQDAANLDPRSPDDLFFVFNLSCFLGDLPKAISVAHEIGGLVQLGDPRAGCARDVCRAWWKTRSDSERAQATQLAKRMSGTIPEVVERICVAFQ